MVSTAGSDLSRAFRRESRLRSGSEYSAVFANSRRFGDRYWTILVSKKVDRSRRARLGLAIAKKRVKKAVGRNRLKRSAREVFRLRQHQLVGLDLVVMCRDAAAGADAREIRQALETLVDKIVKYHQDKPARNRMTRRQATTDGQC